MYTNRLQELCEKDNITTAELSKYVDIDRSVIGKYLNGYLTIPLKHLNSLCNYFDTSLDYILNFTNNKQYTNSLKEIDLDKFSKRLQNFRKENKITQDKLAKILNCSHSAISEYENKKRLITTSHLYSICKKYQISADYLLGKIDYDVKSLQF